MSAETKQALIGVGLRRCDVSARSGGRVLHAIAGLLTSQRGEINKALMENRVVFLPPTAVSQRWPTGELSTAPRRPPGGRLQRCTLAPPSSMLANVPEFFFFFSKMVSVTEASYLLSEETGNISFETKQLI